MEKGLSEYEINDQFKLVEQYCKISDISPEQMLDRVIDATVREIDEDRQEEFVSKVLGDPFAFRISFIVNTPAEDFQNRVELYKLSPPENDYEELLKLANRLRKAGWETYLRNLAHDFMVIVTVDVQKLNGRPGKVAELRENHEKITVPEDGVQKWEIDLWPRARVEILLHFKDKRVEGHWHLLEEHTETELRNTIDWSMIRWMQGFWYKNTKIRDDAYEFQVNGVKTFIYVYDVNGKLLKETRARFPYIPFALKERYKPLLKKEAKKHPLEHPDLINTEDDQWNWERTDSFLEAETSFLESIFRYEKEIGSPARYFELDIKHNLFKEYKKFRKKMKFETASDEDMRSNPKSDFALVEEALSDLKIKDPINQIIVKNFGKSSQEIADILCEKLGKQKTKQAIEKRKDHIIQMIEKAGKLEIKRIIVREAEQRRGWQPPVGKTLQETIAEGAEGERIKEEENLVESFKQDQGDIPEEE